LARSLVDLIPKADVQLPACLWQTGVPLSPELDRRHPGFRAMSVPSSSCSFDHRPSGSAMYHKGTFGRPFGDQLTPGIRIVEQPRPIG
jgi:hypothetical protein